MMIWSLIRGVLNVLGVFIILIIALWELLLQCCRSCDSYADKLLDKINQWSKG